MTRKRDGDIHEILDLHPLYFTSDNVIVAMTAGEILKIQCERISNPTDTYVQ